jgi:predicted rRNA methylase YqxC with S4 and FtsJ domains
VVIDVSFIGLAKVLPAVVEVLEPGGVIAAMEKPQFDLGPHEVKGGVVRDDKDRQRAVDGVIAAARALGLSDAKIMYRHLLPNAMVATPPAPFASTKLRRKDRERPFSF